MSEEINCVECEKSFDEGDDVLICEICNCIICLDCKEKHNCIETEEYENQECSNCGNYEQNMFECNLCGSYYCENCIGQHKKEEMEKVDFEQKTYEEYIKEEVIDKLK